MFIPKRSVDANCFPYICGVVPFTAHLPISFIEVLLFCAAPNGMMRIRPLPPLPPPLNLASKSYPSSSVKLVCAGLKEQNNLLAAAFSPELGFFPPFIQLEISSL